MAALNCNGCIGIYDILWPKTPPKKTWLAKSAGTYRTPFSPDLRWPWRMPSYGGIRSNSESKILRKGPVVWTWLTLSRGWLKGHNRETYGNYVCMLYIYIYIGNNALQARIKDFPWHFRIVRSWIFAEIRVFHQTKGIHAQGYGSTVWISHVSSKL